MFFLMSFLFSHGLPVTVEAWVLIVVGILPYDLLELYVVYVSLQLCHRFQDRNERRDVVLTRQMHADPVWLYSLGVPIASGFGLIHLPNNHPRCRHCDLITRCP